MDQKQQTETIHSDRLESDRKIEVIVNRSKRSLFIETMIIFGIIAGAVLYLNLYPPKRIMLDNDPRYLGWSLVSIVLFIPIFYLIMRHRKKRAQRAREQKVEAILKD